VRDVAFFKRRCEQLGMHFEDNVYEMMYMHDTLGVRRKQYRAMLKRQKKKRVLRVMKQMTTLNF
jgi:hypothetical protein